MKSKDDDIDNEILKDMLEVSHDSGMQLASCPEDPGKDTSPGQAAGDGGSLASDDAILEEILRDMMEITSEDLTAIRQSRERSGNVKSLDEAAFEAGQLTIDQRDDVFRTYLERRVEEMRGKLLGAQLGSYHILEEIASGGMGIVFKARQESPMFTREVALKFMLRGLEGSSEDRERFIGEVKGLASLSHPYLVPIYDSGIKDDLYYFSMELIDGEPLSEVAVQGKLALERKVEIGRDVARALSYLHEHGVIHRDVKPPNIMVDRQGTAKLLDFGIAQFSADARRRVIQAGTPHYMAPEIIDPRGPYGPIGPRADIYALGAVLYYLVFGKEVFSASGGVSEIFSRTLNSSPAFPRSKGERIPSQLEKIIARCLRKRADERYLTAKHLAEELDNFLRWRRGRIPRLVATASLLLVLLMGALFALNAGRRQTSQPPVSPALDFDPFEKAIEEVEQVEPESSTALREALARLRAANGRPNEFEEAEEQFKDLKSQFWAKRAASAQQTAEAAYKKVRELVGEKSIEEYVAGNKHLDEGKGRSPSQETYHHFDSAKRHFEETIRLAEEQKQLRNAAEKADVFAKVKKSQVAEEDLRFSPEAQELYANADQILERAQSKLQTESFTTAEELFLQAAKGFEEAAGLAKTMMRISQERAEREKAALDTLLEGAREAVSAKENGWLRASAPDLFQGLPSLLQEAEADFKKEDFPGCQGRLLKFYKLLEQALERAQKLEESARSARTRAEQEKSAAAASWSTGEMPAALKESWEATLKLFGEGLGNFQEKNFALAQELFTGSEGRFADFSREAKALLKDMVWVEKGNLQALEVPGFYLDRFEVSVGEYDRFLRHVSKYGHVGCCPPEAAAFRSHEPLGWEQQKKEDPNLPVIGVPLADSQAYARFRKKLLPTTEQWELAARRGPSGKLRIFPYGDEFDPRKVNAGKEGEDVPGLLPVDSLPEGASACGCLHMSGNAAEWTVSRDGQAYLMGGSAATGDPAYLRCDRRLKISSGAREELDAILSWIGFRCAVNAIPRKP
ncbi:MAG: protein kinase [Planctomycetes bacterium]|nr:protein kinase [Planctomycetota bacterium]